MQNKHPLATWREKQTPPVTQEELGKAIGASRWTINSIETGRRRAGRDLISKIIAATDGEVGFDQIVAFERQPEAVAS